MAVLARRSNVDTSWVADFGPDVQNTAVIASPAYTPSAYSSFVGDVMYNNAVQNYNQNYGYANPSTLSSGRSLAAQILENIPTKQQLNNEYQAKASTPIYNGPLLNQWDGPFLTTKVNLGLQATTRSREEMASGYQDLWPDLYQSYVSGNINGSQLFKSALTKATLYDSDNLMGASPIKYTQPTKVTYSFNKSGGGSISWSGGSYYW